MEWLHIFEIQISLNRDRGSRVLERISNLLTTMGIIERINLEHSSKEAVIALQKLSLHPKDKSIAALIGVSRGNSYFTKENVGLLTDATFRDFGNVAYMLPDKPSVFTLEALGTGHEKAVSKSRLDFNRYSNMIRGELRRLLDDEGRATLLRWEQVEGNTNYIQCMDALHSLMSTDSQFRDDIHAETERMLVGNLGEDVFRAMEAVERNKRIQMGMQFLLMELSCVVSSANLVGSELCVYIYHRPMEVMRKLLDNEYKGFQNNNAGYLVYEPFESKAAV